MAYIPPPPNASTPRPPSKAMRTEITVYKPDGTTSELGLDTAFQQYWIARYEFMAVLYNAVPPSSPPWP